MRSEAENEKSFPKWATIYYISCTVTLQVNTQETGAQVGTLAQAFRGARPEVAGPGSPDALLA